MNPANERVKVDGLKQGLDGFKQFADFERFGENHAGLSVDLFGDALANTFHSKKSAEIDDSHIGLMPPHSAHHIDAVHYRHDNVCEDQIRLEDGEEVETMLAVGCRLNAISLDFQHFLEQIQQHDVVLDQQKPLAGIRGWDHSALKKIDDLLVLHLLDDMAEAVQALHLDGCQLGRFWIQVRMVDFRKQVVIGTDIGNRGPFPKVEQNVLGLFEEIEMDQFLFQIRFSIQALPLGMGVNGFIGSTKREKSVNRILNPSRMTDATSGAPPLAQLLQVYRGDEEPRAVWDSVMLLLMESTMKTVIMLLYACQYLL